MEDGVPGVGPPESTLSRDLCLFSLLWRKMCGVGKQEDKGDAQVSGLLVPRRGFSFTLSQSSRVRCVHWPRHCLEGSPSPA